MLWISNFFLLLLAKNLLHGTPFFGRWYQARGWIWIKTIFFHDWKKLELKNLAALILWMNVNRSIAFYCSNVPCWTLSYTKIKILTCSLAFPCQFRRLQVCLTWEGERSVLYLSYKPMSHTRYKNIWYLVKQIRSAHGKPHKNLEKIINIWAFRKE